MKAKRRRLKMSAVTLPRRHLNTLRDKMSGEREREREREREKKKKKKKKKKKTGQRKCKADFTI